MWNQAGRNPTWHLRHTFNKKHWERNFTLQGWVNFISPHKALLTLQPFRAVKIREQADARLVCKCNMTITCSEHFEMQHSSPQQQKVKTGVYFLLFSIFSHSPGYFCKLFDSLPAQKLCKPGSAPASPAVVPPASETIRFKLSPWQLSKVVMSFCKNGKRRRE